jgi:hypothetical protein
MACRVARRRAVRVPSRSLSTFPPRSTIIPDGGISPVRLEEQVLNGSLPDPPWPEPRSATSLLPPTAMRCVITELQPLRAGRGSPHRPCSQGPFALMACYRHRPCYSGPMRQSRAHQRTSRFRLYRWPRGQETFPVLHPRPCDRATAHTPESSRGAFARLFPRDPAFAVITPVQRSRFPAAAFSRGRLSTLQRFRHVAARSLARPPGQPRLATARALSSELSSRWSPNPNVRFATWLSGFYHDRSFPGWFGMFTGCTLSPPSLLLRPHAPVYRSPPHFPVVAGYSVGLMNERPSPL